jgi:hypothetical protein
MEIDFAFSTSQALLDGGGDVYFGPVSGQVHPRRSHKKTPPLF